MEQSRDGGSKRSRAASGADRVPAVLHRVKLCLSFTACKMGTVTPLSVAGINGRIKKSHK